MPQITVVIPVHNGMEYLPQTLETVLAQTFRDLEILIVNDGSTDNIIKWSHTLEDSRIRLISQPHQGISIARNRGISQARGNYIAFLDSHDLWQPTKLAKQLAVFKANPQVGLVYTWTTVIDFKNRSLERFLTSRVEGDVWKKLLVADAVGNGTTGNGAS